DRHHQHVARALDAILDRERLGVEALAAATLAVHAHVGQEAHLDLLEPLPFARLAAPARDVEREAARVVAAEPRLGGVGVELAHVVPDSDVGGRAGARRLADRRLVYLEHAADALPAAHAPHARELRLLAAARRNEPGHVVAQNVAHERALAAAANAADAHEPPERQRNVELRKIVARHAVELEPHRTRDRVAVRLAAGLSRRAALGARSYRAPRLQRMLRRPREHAARDRALGAEQILERAV